MNVTCHIRNVQNDQLSYLAIWPFDFSLIDQFEKFSFHILIYANIVGSVSNVGTFSGENPWSVENKKHVVSVKERFSAMTLSTKSSWHDVTLNDAVKKPHQSQSPVPKKAGKKLFPFGKRNHRLENGWRNLSLPWYFNAS